MAVLKTPVSTLSGEEPILFLEELHAWCSFLNDMIHAATRSSLGEAGNTRWWLQPMDPPLPSVSRKIR